MKKVVLLFLLLVVALLSGGYYTVQSFLEAVVPGSPLPKYAVLDREAEFSMNLFNTKTDARYTGAMRIIQKLLKNKIPMADDPGIVNAGSFVSSAERYIAVSKDETDFYLTEEVPVSKLKDLEEKIESFSPANIMVALEKLNGLQRAHPQDLNVFRLIAKGTTILGLYSSPYFLSDEKLEMKAMALNRILEHFCAKNCQEEMALDALLMGDMSYKRGHIQKMTGDVGEFYKKLLGTFENFDEYLRLKKRPLKENFLFLYILLGQSDELAETYYEKYSGELDPESFLPIGVKLAFEQTTFSAGVSNVRAYTPYLFREILDFGEDVGSQHLKLADDLAKLLYSQNRIHLYDGLDFALRKKAMKYVGGLFSEDEYLLYYRNLLYNSLVNMGMFSIWTQSSKASGDATLAYTSTIKSPEGKLAHQYLKAYYDVNIDKKANPQDFLNLLSYEGISMKSLQRLFSRITETMAAEDPERGYLALAYQQRLDNRKLYLSIVNLLNTKFFFNPEFIVGYERGRAGPHLQSYSYSLQQRIIDGEDFDVNTILGDTNLNGPWKRYLIKQMKKWDEVPVDVQQSLYRNLVELFPTRENIDEFLDDLEGKKNYELARSVILVHKDRFKKQNNLSYSNFMARLTLLSLRLKMYPEAAEEVVPAYDSGSLYGLMAQLSVYLFSGQNEKIGEVVERMLERYPGASRSYGLALLSYQILKKEQRIKELLTEIQGNSHINRIKIFELLGTEIEAFRIHFPDYDLRPLFQMVSDESELRWYLAVTLNEWHKLSGEESVLSHIPKISEKNFTDPKQRERVYLHLSKSFEMYQRAGKGTEGLTQISETFGPEGYAHLILAGNPKVFDHATEIVSKLREIKGDDSQLALLRLTELYLRKFETTPFKDELLSLFSGQDHYHWIGRFMLTGEGESEARELSKQMKQEGVWRYFYGVQKNSKQDIKQAYENYLWVQFRGNERERAWASAELKLMADDLRTFKGYHMVRKRHLEKMQSEGKDVSGHLENVNAIIGQL